MLSVDSIFLFIVYKTNIGMTNNNQESRSYLWQKQGTRHGLEMTFWMFDKILFVLILLSVLSIQAIAILLPWVPTTVLMNRETVYNEDLKT